MGVAIGLSIDGLSPGSRSPLATSSRDGAITERIFSSKGLVPLPGNGLRSGRGDTSEDGHRRGGAGTRFGTTLWHMIDHMYLPVTDMARSRPFYGALLKILGIEGSMRLGDSVGFGVGRPGAFWIYPATGRRGPEVDPCGLDPGGQTQLPRLHVAFRAESRKQVHEAFKVGERLGARVLHRPRVFPEYHASYFATFIQDPDGHNIEVVCGTPG
jgi:catechol 2,3-dioxygenase-like lactoylglutathione lyase family enzyme